MLLPFPYAMLPEKPGSVQHTHITDILPLIYISPSIGGGTWSSSRVINILKFIVQSFQFSNSKKRAFHRKYILKAIPEKHSVCRCHHAFFIFHSVRGIFLTGIEFIQYFTLSGFPRKEESLRFVVFVLFSPVQVFYVNN